MDGFTNPIRILPNKIKSINPNKSNSLINWVECNGLKQRNIHMTSSSSNHWYIFNGKANSVLNVLLYPDIPTYPIDDFSSMTKRITEEFQLLHPEILVNIVLSTDRALDTYSFTNLSHVLGPNGFDIVELDTMLLGHVVREGLVKPVELAPNRYWPAAYQTTRYNNLTYGVPSRLCSYFLFGFDPELKNNFPSLDSLTTYLNTLPHDQIALLGDYNEKWNLISFYLQAYVSEHGHHGLNDVFKNDIDKPSIDLLNKLFSACDFHGKNKCINNYYHKKSVDDIVMDFAHGAAYNYLGFSESAFYIRLHSTAHLYANFFSYGDKFEPLLYGDAYVKNAATCNTQRCYTDFNKFTDYMNQVSTQRWINFSEDLDHNIPPRYLLSAIKEFYDLPQVKTDKLYSTFMKELPEGIAYPNDVAKKEHFKTNYYKICKNVQTLMPGYRC